MWRRSLLLFACLLGSASARPLTPTERQEVAQQILTLPTGSRAVSEARLYALTWLGDRKGLRQALVGAASGANSSTFQLIPLALRAGHPELLSELNPQTPNEWGQMVRTLAGAGRYAEADAWLRRLPASQNRILRLADAATMAALNLKTDPDAKKWAATWAQEAETGLPSLTLVGKAQARHLLASSYARLHDLGSLNRLLTGLNLSERNARLADLALESGMSDPDFAPTLTRLIRPKFPAEYARLAQFWMMRGDIAQVRRAVGLISPSAGRDGLLLNLATQVVDAGHPENLPKLLGQITVPLMQASAAAEVATRLAGRGRPDLAARYAQQAHDLAQIRRLDSADLRLSLIQAYGATGRTADAEKLLTGVDKQPQLRVAYLNGLVTGGHMPEALAQASLIREPQHLENLAVTLQLLLQRQRYADLRTLLLRLKPVILGKTSPQMDSPSGRMVRSSYFSFLIRAGAPDALADLTPQDETGMLLHDASTSGRLDLLPTLLAQEALPDGQLAGINEAVVAMGLIQGGYSERALTLFRSAKTPEAKAMIGVALLNTDEPNSIK